MSPVATKIIVLRRSQKSNKPLVSVFCVCSLLQAVPGTASTDGVDPGGGGAHRAPPQLLGGQRRRAAGGPAAAARRRLRATTDQVSSALPSSPPHPTLRSTETNDPGVIRARQELYKCFPASLMWP